MLGQCSLAPSKEGHRQKRQIMKVGLDNPPDALLVFKKQDEVNQIYLPEKNGARVPGSRPMILNLIIVRRPLEFRLSNSVLHIE